MLDTLYRSLRTLADLDAVSGQERSVVAYLKREVSSLTDDAEVDAAGNLYAVLTGAAPGPTVLVAAHSDEIGLIVSQVQPDGFLRFEKVGGVQDALLPARRVRVNGVDGVIGARAGHYASPEESRTVRSHRDLTIDVGARDAAAVARAGIRIGDGVAFVSEVTRFGIDDPLVVGKAVDNRLGCAVLLELLRAGPPPAGRLVAAFTSQEEVGLKGAGIAGERMRPDLALALDTMPSGDTPDMDPLRDLGVRIGGGPVLQVSAGKSGSGFLLPPAVREAITSLAERAEVPLQLCAFAAGNNDAATLAWSGTGVPAASICLPRRYSHSPTEVADLRDAEASLRLLRTLVTEMDDLPDLSFLAGYPA